MRAVWIVRWGGPEVLEVREGPEPEPGPGEVRVRVRAAGVNFADVMARLGLYPDAPRPPLVAGYEVAGVVEAAGEGAGLAPGTRVLGLTRFGGQAEAVAVPAGQVVEMPEGMGFEEGAALPVNYLTAWQALFGVGTLRPGRSVLVHMAAGGVGTAALQLARTVPGVTVLGTASAAKHEALRAEGCDHPIDPRATDWEAEVRRLTGGRGVDLVLDPLGEWRKGYRLLAPSGLLVAYGFANLATGERRNLARVLPRLLAVPRFSPLALMDDNRGVAGLNLGRLWGEVDRLREGLLGLVDLWRRGAVRPRVDSAIPFARAGDAHRRLQGRGNVGKVVLVP